MEVAACRRRRSLIGRAASVDTAPSETKRRTRSAARMSTDSVETAENRGPDDQHHKQLYHRHQQQQQQKEQQSVVEDSVKTEGDDATKSETTSAAETGQSPISAAEQSRGTAAATASDSIVQEIDKTNDDDLPKVDKDPATELRSTDGIAIGVDEQSPQMPESASPRSSEEMYFVTVSDVEADAEADLRETSMSVGTECSQLLGSSDIDAKLPRTDELARDNNKSDTNDVETTDNTPYHHLSDQQQESGCDASVQIENAAETETTTSETGNLPTDAKRGTQWDTKNDKNEENDDRNDEQMDFAHNTDSEEDPEAETLPAVPQAVEDFDTSQKQSTESGDGVQSVDCVTKTEVPQSDSASEVGVSTPIKTEPNSDDDEEVTAFSPPSSVSSRPSLPPPLPATLLFPGEGPPVPVIRVTCGDRRAEFHVDRLVDGLGPVTNSIGTSRTSLCVRTLDDDDNDNGGGDGVWMTPNQFQRASGRGTARDWKRSIKHHGVSLKSLFTKAVLSFDSAAPGCRCNFCTVCIIATHTITTTIIIIIRATQHPTLCGTRNES